MKMNMTKTIAGKFLACAAVTAGLLMSGCSKSDPIDNGNGGGDNDDFVVLQGDLSTRTLTADQKYLIKGQVFVRDGQVLTIEPGTVLFGEKSTKGTLIIDRGGKIMAEGTIEKPIIMTSNQEPGARDRSDWGGLVVLGKARVNIPDPAVEGVSPAVIYGGNDDDDNSGIMKYLRVEFAGIELTANNETNGITLGGVGRGTVFENIQVSYGGDDGIEWFGGSVDGKHLIVFGTWDDSFDIDNGFSGSLQFGLALHYPSFADQSESNGFEWDTDGQNVLDRFKTSVVASNFTVIGPSIDGNSYSANYRHAVDLRRNVAGSIFNSVFVGFPTALRMNQSSVMPNYVDGTGVISNNIFLAKTNTALSGSDVTPQEIINYLTANGNTIEAGNDAQTSDAYTALGIKPEIFFKSRTKEDYPKNPNFSVIEGSTLASGAKFDHAKFNEEGRADKFDKTVAFRGAFGSTDWTAGWSNFNPVMEQY